MGRPTDGTVTNAKLAAMAEATFKMRAAGAGTGAPIDGTVAQAKTALGISGRRVSPREFGAIADGVTDDSAAIQDALDELAGYGTLVLDGTFAVESGVSYSGAYDLSIVGDGKFGSCIVANTGGIRLFDITLADSSRKLRVANFVVFPNAITAVTSVIRVTSPEAASSAYKNFIAENVECYNLSPDTGEAKTCKRLFETVFIWSPTLINCTHFARTLQPGSAGDCLLFADRTLDANLFGCNIHFGDALVYQNSYCEGLNATHCTVVGSNHAMNQNPAISAVLPWGGKLYQAVWTGCEVNAY